MKTGIASKDANLEPTEVAEKIVNFYEKELLKEVNGIIEIEIIEW